MKASKGLTAHSRKANQEVGFFVPNAFASNYLLYKTFGYILLFDLFSTEDYTHFSFWQTNRKVRTQSFRSKVLNYDSGTADKHII